jgi:DNA polymerase-3 subunit chi
MTEVIFVETTAGRMETRACEIAERSYTQGHRLQIIAAGEEQASRLDELLWTFRPDSFVPHDLFEEQSAQVISPIIITTAEERIGDFDSMLMMGYCPVEVVGRFAQVFHLVVVDHDERLDASRRYWAQLKETGFTLRHQRR